jgi:hypothetical protein
VPEPARHCACGCKKVVKGPPTKRYYDSTHAKRAQRAARAGSDVDSVATVPPAPNGDGRVLPALEEWVEDRPDLPLPLVASALALAREVDRQPTNSPLWGRLSTVLTELVTPAVQAKAWSAAVRELYEEFATMSAAEEWRHQRYLRAVDDGEPHPGRWSHLVPIACALGDHRWHQWGGPESPKACLDCRGRLEDDGVVRWPPDLVGALWEAP